MGLSNYLPSSRISQSGVCTSTTRPASPYEGQMIYETDTNRVLVWDNAAWVMIADTDQPPGLQLIKTQTIGSSVSSITVTDAFNSDFENYRVIIHSDSNSSNNADVSMQLRTSGGTTSTTGYYRSLVYTNYTGTPSAAAASNDQWWLYVVSCMGTSGGYGMVDLLRPNETKYTTIFGQMNRGDVSGVLSGYHAVSTAYSSFVLTVNSGTLTGGTIRVYGYRNS